jgi:RNA polymerase sigma-70 factor (ECF subfamily)
MLDGLEGVDGLLSRLADGDVSALGGLFAHYRGRLRGEIARELARDPRLGTRFDASDVVQEVLCDAQKRVGTYLADRERIEFLAWLRGLARERRLKFQRDHLDAQCRSLKRQEALPEESWRHPPSDQDTPSQAARTAERDERLRQALARLKPEDQEVIRLRLFDGMTNPGAAEHLGLTAEAAAKRLQRAMHRLREELGQVATNDSHVGPSP